MSSKEDYKKIISQIGFKESQILKYSESEGYIVSEGRFLDKEAILKVSIKKNGERVDRLKKEILVDQVVNDQQIELKEKKVVAKIIDSGETKEYFWVLKDYLPGVPLGQESKSDDPLFNNPIRTDFLTKGDEIIEKVVENLKALKLIKDIRLKDVPKRFCENIEDCDIETIEKDLSVSLSLQISYYKSKAEYYLRSDFQCGCDGDLTPSNVIVGRDGQVSFSDLEWFCADNYMVDFTYFWLYLWRNPNWQSKLTTYLGNDEDKEFFRCSIIREIIYLFDFVLKHTKHKEKRIDDLKNHIFLRYLIAASKSPENIFRVNRGRI